MAVVIVVVVIVVLIVLGALVARRRRSPDGVEGFRRQIDALSSDARRPTIGQLHDDNDPDHAEAGPSAEPDEDPDDDGADQHGS